MSINKEKEAVKKLSALADYLSAAQIFLKDNFLLERELKSSDIKDRLLGHWGTCPGINYVYANLNNLICKTKKDFLFIVGPGHGFPAYQTNIFLEKSLTAFYPKKIPYNKKGLFEIIENFSTPYGYPSHLNPEAPGAILEGGELGYSLAFAAGTVMDNKNLITAVLIGDGEAETGALSASWAYNRFLNPKRDGAVLPILHLNGYKISGPTLFGRMKDSEIKKYFQALSYEPLFIDFEKDKDFYLSGVQTFAKAYKMIEKIKEEAKKEKGDIKLPKWPLIILKSPKGMGTVKSLKGRKIEGNYLSHQVIFDNLKNDPEQIQALEKWLTSYDIKSLLSFDKKGDIVLDKDIQSIIPPLKKTIGSNPLSYAKDVSKKLILPKLSKLQDFPKSRGQEGENSMAFAGKFFKEIFKENEKNKNFRIFSPDETYSNRIDAVFDVTSRVWMARRKESDENMSQNGGVVELLSEHVLFGMLWGYTLTGRHGFFVSYEAFAQIVASMADQYVKYLKASKKVSFRKKIPALNVILSSLLERQDHNGFSHQSPSFISTNLDRDRDIVNVYFPADRNLTLEALRLCSNSTDSFNIIVAGKKMKKAWLNKKEAETAAKDGLLVWDFLSDKKPELVVATCGDYVVEEAILGLEMFKERFPEIPLRFVNFFKLDVLSEGNKKMTKEKILKDYLTENAGIVFNYHGYRGTIKRLLFEYNLSERIIINGYEEEGSTTSPFDMKARNGLSRMHLTKDLSALALKQRLISEKQYKEVEKEMDALLKKEKEYIKKYKVDPEWI